MVAKKNRLSDMEYDEVSLVGIPCNQHADIVLFKSFTNPEPVVTVERRSRAGQLALARHAVALSKMSPTASDVHEETLMMGKKKKCSCGGAMKNGKCAKCGKGKKSTREAGDPMIEITAAG